jgi:S1-C subfamily serine protease
MPAKVHVAAAADSPRADPRLAPAPNDVKQLLAADRNQNFRAPDVAKPVGNGQSMIDRVKAAVVTIQTSSGIGSGVILDEHTVVTNFHVVAGCDSAEVVLNGDVRIDGSEYWAVWPECDIAILRVTIRHEIVPVAIAQKIPTVGEKVLAFGSPLSLRGTVSDGIVSGIRRAKEIEAANRFGYQPDSLWLQTTAPISPGNSGGPLVNSNGEIVGLSTWTDHRGQNLNFAISAVQISSLMKAPWYGKDIRKLSALPKQETSKAVGFGTAKPTLEFWNAWAKLRTKSRALPNIHPKGAVTRIKFNEQITRAYLTYAASVTGLRTADVDPVLLRVVSNDSAIFRRLGESFARSSDAIRAKNNQVLTKESNEITMLNRQLTESDNALTELRVALAKHYAVEFPSFFQASGEATTTPARKETQAAKDLKQAKLMIEAGERETAKSILRRIREKYPNEPQADEAGTILKTLTK